MLFSSLEVQQFKTQGFILGPKVMSVDEANALRERMFRVLEGKTRRQAELNRNLLDGQQDRVVRQVVNIWEADEGFHRHIYNEYVCAMAAQLMDAEVVRVWHDQIQYKPPLIGGPTDWHQDYPRWPVIQPACLVSAWVALDDATVENGCMWMVPKSHRWGIYKDGILGTDAETFDPTPDMSLLSKDAAVRKVACPVRKGQVMFHHCLTWHGSPKNDSERGRPAIAVHYMPGHTRYQPGEREHAMSRRIAVEPGAVLEGEYFPTVWDHGPVEPTAMPAG